MTRSVVVELFGYQSLIVLLALSLCSEALTITYCSPELVAQPNSNRTTNIYMSNGVCNNICEATSSFAVILGMDCWCSDYVPSIQYSTALCNTPCPGYPPDTCGNTTSNLYAYFNLNRRASGTVAAFTAGTATSTSVPSNIATSASSTASTSSDDSNSAAAAPAATSANDAGGSSTGTTDASTTSAAAGGSSFTATDPSAIALYLQTAIPASARSQSSDACFLNSGFSYYSTPTWYEQFPTQVQSYYSSSAQGQTAACTLSASQLKTTAQHSSGLSKGAIAGIVVGVIIGVLIILALLFLCIRRRKRNRRRAEAIANGKADLEREKAAIPATSYVNRNPRYAPTRSDDEDFTALPSVREPTIPPIPPSAHMQTTTHPAFMSAAQGRHISDSIQSSPALSEYSRNEHLEAPSKPWLNYANQGPRSEMSEDQQFFPALQQQNPYQLDPELDFGTYNQNIANRRPVGGVGQSVHAGGMTGGFGFSDGTGYESGGERSWYHAR